MNLGFYNTNLPPHLRVLKDEIEAYARGYGLDFFETIFEVVDADDLNAIHSVAIKWRDDHAKYDFSPASPPATTRPMRTQGRANR